MSILYGLALDGISWFILKLNINKLNIKLKKKRDSIINHLKQITVKKTKCNLKLLTIDEKNKSENHINSVHDKKHIIKCNYCQKHMYSKSLLDRHIKSVHGELSTYKCKFCHHGFSNQKFLKEHIRSIHNQTKSIQCNHCTQHMNTKSDLDRHVESVHKDVNPLKCQFCNMCFNKQDLLNEHIRSSHDKSKKFQCNDCNYSTKTKYLLNRHNKSIHRNVKDFSCQICKIVLKSISSLRRHIKIVHKENHNKTLIRSRISRKRLRKRKKRQLNNDSLVYNFSNIELTDVAKKLLSKGLNYCPTPKSVNTTQIISDLDRLERSMAWHTIFGNSRNDDKYNDINENTKEYLFEKNRKTNLPKQFPKEITEFVNAVKSDLLGNNLLRVHPNLSKEENEELRNLISLQKDGKIVIQPADKNLGVVILNRDDYVNEGLQQLNETVKINGNNIKYYEKVNSNLLKSHFITIEKYLSNAVEKGIITKKTAKQLLPTAPKAGKMYLPPKVHKEFDKSLRKIPKCRPIIL